MRRRTQLLNPKDGQNTRWVQKETKRTPANALFTGVSLIHSKGAKQV